MIDLTHALGLKVVAEGVETPEQWSLAGDAEEYRLSNERRQLLLVLQKAQAPMPPKEIAEATGKSHALPAASAYSAYPANPSDEEGDEGKDGKRSKGGDGTAPIICIHGYPGGRGCYLCDPDHPNRGEGGA
jgi:hypothetical protein